MFTSALVRRAVVRPAVVRRAVGRRFGFVAGSRVQGRLLLAVAAVAAVAGVGGMARGADGVWSGGAVGPAFNWSDPLNWVDGAVPGGATPSGANDLATFTNDDTLANRTVTLDAPWTVGSLTFVRTGNANVFAVGATANVGPALTVQNGGSISQTFGGDDSAAAVSNRINSPLLLAGNTYTISNDAPQPHIGLLIAGDIAGGAAGTTTLNLMGQNQVGDNKQGNSKISGTISNGASSVFNVVKSGTGIWDITGTSSYTGTTTVNGGVLRLSSLVAGSAKSDYVLNEGSMLVATSTAPYTTVRSVTMMGSAGLIVGNNGTSALNIANNAGPAIVMDFSGRVANQTINSLLNLTGTVAQQGGITVVSAGSQISLGSILDIGSVDRVFDVADGPANLDLQVNRGPKGSGGIIKTGPGLLKFQAPNNVASDVASFTGTLEVRQGTVTFRNSTDGSANDLLTNKPPLLVTGGTIDVGSLSQSFASVTGTKGAISGGTSTTTGTYGTVKSNSFNLNVGTGDTLTVTAILADLSSSAAVTKTGAGTVILDGSSAYTGGTTISGGTLQVGNSTTSSVRGTPGPANIVDNGKLAISRTNTWTLPNNITGTGSVEHINTGSTTLSGNLSYSGNTTVSAGTLDVLTPLRPVTGSLVVTGPGATMRLDAPATAIAGSGRTVAGEFAAVSSSAGGSILVPVVDRAANKATVVVAGSLSVSGGSLDLGTGDMIVKNGAGSIGALQAAFGSGQLLASGTSAGAFTTLAIFSNDAGGSAYLSSYDGVAIGSSAAILKTTYVGDTNLDGILDANDLAQVIEGYSTGRSGWNWGDVDNSGGAVSLADMTAFLTAYNNVGGGVNFGNGTGDGSEGGSVPEPGAVGLVVGGAMVLGRRRR